MSKKTSEKTSEKKAVRFFTRFLILSVLSVLNTIISFSLLGNGTFLQIIAGLLAVTNVFLLIYMALKSIVMAFGHLVDKERKRFEFMYLFNIVFSVFVTGLYLFFYFIIIMGVLIILLPFLA